MNEKYGIFGELYRKDKRSGSFIIEIALDKYSDIFSEWDPAPFKLRDIDPDLAIYLEGCSDEIPFRFPITLQFTIPKGTRNEQIEDQARNGLKNGFKFKIYFLKKNLEATNARTILFFLIGFAFLWVATIFPKQLAASVFPSIIVEGLFIGGWVFIWEAISLLLFTSTQIHHHIRHYKRLLKAKSFFTEMEQDIDKL
ncbi:MAG: hypothetical protein GX640_01705 [Fibrobacter sp.]|nr:hypothetical protein [Fibrobacter sp.]